MALSGNITSTTLIYWRATSTEQMSLNLLETKRLTPFCRPLGLLIFLLFYLSPVTVIPPGYLSLGGKELTSAEGTTQGDPLAMALYALSIQPLITGLHAQPALSQKSSNGGMVSIHSVRTSVTFQTLKSAGSSQSQKKRHWSEKGLKIQSLTWQ